MSNAVMELARMVNDCNRRMKGTRLRGMVVGGVHVELEADRASVMVDLTPGGSQDALTPEERMVHTVFTGTFAQAVVQLYELEGVLNGTLEPDWRLEDEC